MATVLTAPSVLGDLVKREFDRDYTRETVTLRAGTAYPMGAVLGRVTADGTYALSPAVVSVLDTLVITRKPPAISINDLMAVAELPWFEQAKRVFE